MFRVIWGSETGSASGQGAKRSLNPLKISTYQWSSIHFILWFGMGILSTLLVG